LGQLKVMSAIENCRTAALGGHVTRCENDKCGHTRIAYNSCLMGSSSNGELARPPPHFPVHHPSFALHYMSRFVPGRRGHYRLITSGDDHVGDLLLSIEDAGASAQRAKRSLSRLLCSGARTPGLQRRHCCSVSAGGGASNAECLLKSFAAFAAERGQPHVHAQSAIDWAALGPSVAQRDARLKAVCRFVR